MYHGAGWMEGGLTASFEKLVIDVEMMQMLTVTIGPADRSTSTRSGRGRCHRGRSDRRPFLRLAAHARAVRDGILRAAVSNWQNYESWEAAGSPTVEERATRVWQEALERYEQPALEPDRAERLDAFVERRKVELRDVDH